MNKEERNNLFDLSRGSKIFLASFKERYPEMSEEDVQRIANLVLEQMGEHLERGERLAFMKEEGDTTEITVFSLEISEKAEES